MILQDLIFFKKPKFYYIISFSSLLYLEHENLTLISLLLYFKSTECHKKKEANHAVKQQILYANSDDAGHELDFKLAGSRLSLEYFHSYFCNHNINQAKKKNQQIYMDLVAKKRK